MYNFAGKNFLVAGASSGIGRDVARYLTEECGANVALVARREDVIAQLADELQGSNLAIQYDLEDIENIEEIFKTCNNKNFKLDGMVYSAGISPLFPIAENEAKLMEKVMRVNALAFAELGKYMLNYKYVKDRAAVVAISSIVSVATTNRQSAYAASKSMLNTYVRFLAKEALGKMRVNAILPGVVETDMVRTLRSQSDNFDEKTKKNQPLGIIPPRKISEMVGFLLSESAAYVTGASFVMDGGYLLK